MNKKFISGTLAVMCTYMYFLLFAQYGFIHLLKDQNITGQSLDLVLAAMGVMGFLSSLGSGWFLSQNQNRARKWVVYGFFLSSVSAFLSLILETVWQSIAISAVIGLALGMLTVGLASGLKHLIGNKLGIGVGFGTGLAYALSNLSALFEGSATTIAWTCGMIGILGLVVSFLFPSEWPEYISPTGKNRKSVWFFLLFIVGFTSLVWLDSAAFFVIQETSQLKARIWASPDQKSVIALAHLLAAIVTGFILDRVDPASHKKWIVFGILAAYFSIAAGYGAIQVEQGIQALSGPFYAMGVSIYSTLLVAFAGLNLEPIRRIPPAWQAGLLFGIAGWIGSANGIGMVKELERVPIAFFLISATGIGIMAWVFLAQRRAEVTFLLLVFLVLFLPKSKPQLSSPIERGRNVYISQGCIHCHSQYVRPIPSDVANFGPSSEMQTIRQQRPPLIGYRRQGPDLTHTGSRKPRIWQEGHLKDPRQYTPGSVMPSYAFLFKQGNSDGPDLLEYLSSLR